MIRFEADKNANLKEQRVRISALYAFQSGDFNSLRVVIPNEPSDSPRLGLIRYMRTISFFSFFYFSSFSLSPFLFLTGFYFLFYFFFLLVRTNWTIEKTRDLSGAEAEKVLRVSTGEDVKVLLRSD